MPHRRMTANDLTCQIRHGPANVRNRRYLDLRHGIREGRQSLPAAVIPLAGGPSVVGQTEKDRHRRNTAGQLPTAEMLANRLAQPVSATERTRYRGRKWPGLAVSQEDIKRVD
jgi:hypothetical protein